MYKGPRLRFRLKIGEGKCPVCPPDCSFQKSGAHKGMQNTSLPLCKQAWKPSSSPEAQDSSEQTQAESLIAAATDPDELAQMYEGRAQGRGFRSRALVRVAPN